MNFSSIILLILLGVLVIAAVRYMWKHRGEGGCSGNCGACSKCGTGCSSRKDMI